MNTNETNPHLEKVEKLAEQLHIWYLEATKELNPKSYNPNAQKSYVELTDEQRFIDRYIAEKVSFSRQEPIDALIKEVREIWEKNKKAECNKGHGLTGQHAEDCFDLHTGYSEACSDIIALLKSLK